MADRKPIAEVSFYDLANQNPLDKLTTACRLVARAFDISKNVFVWTSDENETKKMSDLLWQHPKGRFIPHTIGSEKPDYPNLVRIGTVLPDDNHYLVINLTNERVGIAGKYERIFEIVLPADFEASNERFKHYDGLECTVQRHSVSKAKTKQ